MRYNRTKMSYKLQKQIDDILDNAERLTTMACMYIHKFTIDKLIILFHGTEEVIIECLQYEQVYKHKVCIKCSKLKDYRHFTKRSKNPDGLHENCKACNSKVNKKYRKQNGDKLNTQAKENKTWKKYDRKDYMKEYRSSQPLYNTFAYQLQPIEQTRNNNNILEVKCTYCNKWFIPTNLCVSTRIQCIKGNGCGENRFYCSDGCKGECDIFNQFKYPKGFKRTQLSREVQPQLRKLVLERDNWTCQKCNSQDSLHCHHITGIEQNPIESADIDNCITFCKGCHKEVHKQDGCTYRDLRRCA